MLTTADISYQSDYRAIGITPIFEALQHWMPDFSREPIPPVPNVQIKGFCRMRHSTKPKPKITGTIPFHRKYVGNIFTTMCHHNGNSVVRSDFDFCSVHTPKAFGNRCPNNLSENSQNIIVLTNIPCVIRDETHKSIRRYQGIWPNKA